MSMAEYSDKFGQEGFLRRPFKLSSAAAHSVVNSSRSLCLHLSSQGLSLLLGGIHIHIYNYLAHHRRPSEIHDRLRVLQCAHLLVLQLWQRIQTSKTVQRWSGIMEVVMILSILVYLSSVRPIRAGTIVALTTV